MDSTQIWILVIGAVVAAVVGRLLRARLKGAPPVGRHDILMTRAQAYADKSAFLKKACRDYRATGHLSERQVEAVEKALARVEPN